MKAIPKGISEKARQLACRAARQYPQVSRGQFRALWIEFETRLHDRMEMKLAARG